MINFRNLLTEAFNSPYKWRWDLRRDDSWVGRFKTKDNDEINVRFDLFDEDEEAWTIEFSIPKNPNEFARTNKYDAFKIFSTIIAMTKEFVEIKDPDYMEFTGSKRKGLDKMYEMILKSFQSELRSYGYTTTSVDRVNYIEFRIRRGY